MILTRHPWIICLTLAGALFALPASVRCQQVPDAFWDGESRKQAAFAAVQMITQPNPYMMYFVREQGRFYKEMNVWHELPWEPTQGAPALNSSWLRKIKDRKPMPDVRGLMPHERGPYYNLFCQALLYSYLAPLEAFEKSAADNEHVTFAHLNESKNESSRYRGKVIPVTGQLLRLRRKDAPIPMLDEGVRFIYEGWIQGPTKGAPPFWVVVPNAPEDPDDPTGLLRPEETMNRSVKFYGYFIQMLRYEVEVDKGDARRDAPLLIGPKLIVTGPAVPASAEEPVTMSPFSSMLLVILAAFGGFAFAVLLALTWWFRSGDRRFRDRLHHFHATQAVDMLDNNRHETAHEQPKGMALEDDTHVNDNGPPVPGEK